MEQLAPFPEHFSEWPPLGRPTGPPHPGHVCAPPAPPTPGRPAGRSRWAPPPSAACSEAGTTGGRVRVGSSGAACVDAAAGIPAFSTLSACGSPPWPSRLLGRLGGRLRVAHGRGLVRHAPRARAAGSRASRLAFPALPAGNGDDRDSVTVTLLRFITA